MRKQTTTQQAPCRICAVKRALWGRYLRRSLIVAVVVGVALNLINQGDALLNGGAVVVWKMALTFCVPFCVSTIASSFAIMELEIAFAEERDA